MVEGILRERVYWLNCPSAQTFDGTQTDLYLYAIQIADNIRSHCLTILLCPGDSSKILIDWIDCMFFNTTTLYNVHIMYKYIRCMFYIILTVLSISSYSARIQKSDVVYFYTILSTSSSFLRPVHLNTSTKNEHVCIINNYNLYYLLCAMGFWFMTKSAKTISSSHVNGGISNCVTSFGYYKFVRMIITLSAKCVLGNVLIYAQLRRFQRYQLF